MENTTHKTAARAPFEKRANARTPTSEVLRSILTKNPGLKTFSVERILASIGDDRFEASLVMFSIPAIVPVPGPRDLVTMPMGVIACQLASGQPRIKLPRFILNKSVSRRSLAVAIHAILPVLEAAEKVVRPRWSWVSHALSRRAIGLFVFLLAIAIAYPLFGFSAFHAMSIIVISLGMAERDGLAVVLGVVTGILSLAMLVTTGMSPRVLRARLAALLRKTGRKLGLTVFASYLRKKGYTRLARIVSFEWAQLLLRWDPEHGAARAASEMPRELPEQTASAPGASLTLAPRASVVRAAPPQQRPADPTLAHGERRLVPC